MMNDRRKSDSSVVSTKLSNNISNGDKKDHDQSYTGTQAETPDTDKDKYMFSSPDCGGNGEKGIGQREPEPTKHSPDTVPGKGAQ